LFLSVSSAHAASFDCTKANSQAEKLICRSPALSQADERLYQDYLQAKQATGNSAEFKKMTKANWKLREKCTTTSCLSDWYTNSSYQYHQISLKINNQQCLNEGDELSLSGLMIRMTYPGPPNYESIADGDTPETVFILKPDQPINCASDAPTFDSFKLMQLVFSSQGDYKKYQNLIGGANLRNRSFILFSDGTSSYSSYDRGFFHYRSTAIILSAVFNLSF